MARRDNSPAGAAGPGARIQARKKLSRFRHIASLNNDTLMFAPDHRRIRLSLRLDYRPPLGTLDPPANAARYITDIVRSSAIRRDHEDRRRSLSELDGIARTSEDVKHG